VIAEGVVRVRTEEEILFAIQPSHGPHKAYHLCTEGKLEQCANTLAQLDAAISGSHSGPALAIARAPGSPCNSACVNGSARLLNVNIIRLPQPDVQS